MKTFFSLRHAIMTLLLVGVLISCQDDTLVLNQDDTLIQSEPEVKYAESKTRKEIITEQSDTLITTMPITKEMDARVMEVVKPVQEIMGKLLNEDETGTFEAYKEDGEKLRSLKDLEEKQVFIKKIHDKYLDFFSQVWKKADIDEGYYQQLIRDAFPKEMQDNIEFTEFLNFSVHIKKPRDYTPPAPEPPPAPENICTNAMASVFGIKVLENYGLAKATGNAVPPTYLDTYTVAEYGGLAKATVGAASNITIPGTFPDDDRVLRVKKDFDWEGHIFNFSALGFSFGSIQYTTIMTEEYIRLYAPVTFVTFTDFTVHRSEEYLIEKRWLYNIRYGASFYSDDFAEIFALSRSSSAGHNLVWTVCEEKKPD